MMVMGLNEASVLLLYHLHNPHPLVCFTFLSFLCNVMHPIQFVAALRLRETSCNTKVNQCFSLCTLFSSHERQQLLCSCLLLFCYIRQLATEQDFRWTQDLICKLHKSKREGTSQMKVTMD